MSQTVMCDVAAVPRIMHREAMQITAVENQKFADLLGSLDGADWTKPPGAAVRNAS